MSQHGSGFGGYGGGSPPGYPPGGGVPPASPPGGGAPPGGGGPGYPPGGGAPPGGAPPGYPPSGGPPGYPPGGGTPPGYPPPGYPPGGGGPPGYPPQGGYPPTAYAAPGYPQQPGYPAAPAPQKKSSALLWVGIGCGGLFLLSAIGGAAAWYFTMRAAQEAIAAASAFAPTGAPAASPTDASGAPTDGACAKAVACCRKIIQKSNAGAQAEAGCLGLKQLSEQQCQAPLNGYQQSAKLLGTSCD